jgi:3-oxoadipate enol-lactonase
MNVPALTLPWLPEGRTVSLPGRGETFVRIHRHADPGAPWLLLLHGWTASADLQFFTAYEALAEHYSFVAIDHRGHGRGMRTARAFQLEDAADDAAAVVTQLGIGPVITIGYSMGGPISLHLAHRHPDAVKAMVVQATALEWRASRSERIRWKTVRLIGPIMRSWAYPRWLRYGITKLLGVGHELEGFVPWLEAETRRGDPLAIVQAGRALSRYDARPWASSLGKPAASLITTDDRLVLPRKQRELANALGAHVVEVAGDHLVPWERPQAFSDATLALVDHLTGRSHEVASSAESAAAAG